MKIKLYGSKSLSQEEKNYLLKLKKENENIFGNVNVNFSKKRIIVDMERTIDKGENLAILKELFYDFCVSGKRKFKRENESETYNFKYVLNKQQDFRSVSLIEEIMKYTSDCFSKDKKKEGLISEIVESYETILEEKKNGNHTIRLQNIRILDYGMDAIDTYVFALKSYLKKKNLNGVITEERIVPEYVPQTYAELNMEVRLTYQEKVFKCSKNYNNVSSDNNYKNATNRIMVDKRNNAKQCNRYRQQNK